jgi:hypothetical protein
MLILLVAAALGGFYAVLRHPPAIRAEIFLPAPNVSRQVAAPALDDPIPEDVLDYIDQESEEHARVTRRLRARALRQELGNWESAFRMLQREDATQ